MRNEVSHGHVHMLDQSVPPVEATGKARCFRILIVDDDAIAREQYVRYLQADPAQFYAIVEAATADECARHLVEESFDCLVLDYQLPGTDGLAILESLRAEGSVAAELPVVMMTGHGSEKVAVAAMKLGVADYLPKEDLTAAAFRRAIANAADIYRLRNALRSKNERLAHLNDELRARTSELQRFYHTVSHELKTPLTAVREFVSLVREGVAGPAESHAFLDHALTGCDLMALQVNELLEVARVDSDRLPLSLRPVAIGRCCEFALAALRHQADAKQVRLLASIDTGLPDAMADEARVIQVLDNLLANAIKFTASGGRVEVRARVVPAAGCLEVEVQDTGCGIGAEHLPHLWERLYQVPGTRQTGADGGLGLGLYIARELVERQGGTIGARSTPGVGSTFHFRLPLAASGRQGAVA